MTRLCNPPLYTFMMKALQETLNTLQDLLVDQFRAFQILSNLMQDERLALARGDVSGLPALARQQETVLEQIDHLRKEQRSTVQSLVNALEISPLKNDIPALVKAIPSVDAEYTMRLANLQEGIRVLTEQARDLAYGNRALATTSLEQTSALQARLLSLCLFSSQSAAVPPVFAAIVAARDAMNASSPSGISDAASELRQALERLDRPLAAEEVQQQAGLHHPHSTSLIETIADLYHQESAYQIVLKVSDHMLMLTDTLMGRGIAV